MDNTSTKYSLNSTDLHKITRGFVVTLAGTALTYLAAIYGNVDYSVSLKGTTVNLTPLLIPLFGAMIEAGRRYLADYSK